jgi:hypothetical protein
MAATEVSDFIRWQRDFHLAWAHRCLIWPWKKPFVVDE